MKKIINYTVVDFDGGNNVDFIRIKDENGILYNVCCFHSKFNSVSVRYNENGKEVTLLEHDDNGFYKQLIKNLNTGKMGYYRSVSKKKIALFNTIKGIYEKYIERDTI